MQAYKNRNNHLGRVREKAVQDATLKQASKIVLSFFLLLIVCAFCNSLLQ